MERIPYFRKVFMQKLIFISFLFLIGCVQNQQVHPPVGGILSEKDLNNSKNRAKNLNQVERTQIQDWINNQAEKFYPMSLNYWVNIENLQQNQKKPDGETISYEYEIYDFDWVKLYDEPVKILNVNFGRFEELKPIEDALRYMNEGEEVTLLIPSALAYGAVGDGDKISNDMPLIVKLKVL